MLCVKTYHRKCIAWTEEVNLAVMPEQHARFTDLEPNDGLDESGTQCMSIADGDDEDLMGIENS